MKILKFPFYLLVMAAYPVVALLSFNIKEVDWRVMVRPLLISLSGSLILFCILRWLLKDWHKAGLTTAGILFLFFTYGHVYNLLEQTPIFGMNLGRHRYLAFVYTACLLLGMWLLGKIKRPQDATPILNGAGLVMILIPLVQITTHLWRADTHQRETAAVYSSSAPLLEASVKPLPDIYYIILDSHTRSDALLADFGYDNTAFLENLRTMGLFVTDCSRSNYTTTQDSLISTLNMDYVDKLVGDLQELNLGDDQWILVRQSRVRRMLEELGYKTFSFDSGFEWSRLKDADTYLSLGSESAMLQMITPFEAMLFKSTAGLILSDSQNKVIRSQFEPLNFTWGDHVNAQRFILDQLPTLPDYPGPKFVFVHILIPHQPFVFQPNGEIVTDPRFYDGDRWLPSEPSLINEGYTNQVAYIDQAISEVLAEIISKSSPPPVIFMHGDHGWIDQNRLLILSAYYLPGQDLSLVYPTISPVNSFRVIFNTYFGTDYELLPDISYNAEYQAVPETSPACLAP